MKGQGVKVIAAVLCVVYLLHHLEHEKQNGNNLQGYVAVFFL